MDKLKNYVVFGLSLFVVLLFTGCASTGSPIDPADRDTTGAYDGVWLGSVSGPRSNKALLPNNATLTCEWDPFDILMTVEDGTMEIAGLEDKTPVSTTGDFFVDFLIGSPTLRGGVSSGTERSGRIFSGSLAAEKSSGKFQTYITTFGKVGCQGSIAITKRSS